MSNNGQVKEIEVIPDFENEMVNETPTPKKEGCGCQNKQGAATPTAENENKINWMRIGLIAGSLMVAYFLFVKKGKVEVPKVEVPEV